ncbi:MAG: hypothetical protein AB3N64_04250 [Puniceicoccaceae bacterium]
MSAAPEQIPEVVNFPDPRKFPDPRTFPDPRKGLEQRKKRKRISLPRPSIDTILKRTDPTKVNAVEDADPTQIDCFMGEEPGEAEIIAETDKIARLKEESLERIRAARELEVLLETREKQLDQRETEINSRLAENVSHHLGLDKPQPPIVVQQELQEARQLMAEKEELIASLRAEIEQLKEAAAQSDGQDDDGYEAVTDLSLEEQVAFLREREAFIEQSENVLFDKAQQLQEWEASLEQVEHDQKSG